MIREKVKTLHADPLKDTPGTSIESGSLKATRGWFNKFKRGIHSVVRHGEAANSNNVAAADFVTEFQEYVEAEGFVPQQVFNCDETGLF